MQETGTPHNSMKLRPHLPGGGGIPNGSEDEGETWEDTDPSLFMLFSRFGLGATGGVWVSFRRLLESLDPILETESFLSSG